MRPRSVVPAALCAVLALTACTPDNAPAGAAAADQPLPELQVPASAAGGACILLDYPQIEEHIGVRFDVAASDQSGETATCVVQTEGSTRPDLTLVVVESTTADARTYLAELKPKGAKSLSGLGAAAYRQVLPAEDGAGPAVELGWLTKDKQLLSLRFTFGDGAGEQEANDMAGRLVNLAQALDSDEL
ncbi:hypothetical protein [Spirilliplanes yamanashiensis]|uniref:hypothetical protein n=1 Tax=Spirilliplanes yamanashiensis TaxID=42233 RepID=UPI00194DC3A1|nr:hypothetical protein [Spirilliplanes yamanashiensis]MDP9819544.1 hypothetical protein [Spirilliplanes yamanashiensis]